MIKIPTTLVNAVKQLAIEAGQIILNVYQHAQVDIQQKDNNTPVTQADLCAHDNIVAGLAGLNPVLPILSEEDANIDFAKRSTWQQYWLVDPLDGTKEFIHRNGEFTVNIALVQAHQPIIGVIYVPVQDTCYYAALGQGAYKQQSSEPPITIQTRVVQKECLTAVLSRSHSDARTQQFIDKVGDISIRRVGSSLKLCLLAEGLADIGPRFSPTSEWDIAAGQCILEEAGGQVLDLQGQPLRYNTRAKLLNPKFLAIADPGFDWHQFL